MSGKAATVRIDRLLGGLGYGSRKEIAAMAGAGWLRLDGAVLGDASARIAISADLSQRLTLKGRPVDPMPGMVVMLHKPLGVSCSRKEAGALVYDLLPPRWLARDPALSTVGRLDKETSGLLLLTDDGALLHRIISPKSHLAKRYRVGLARPMTGEEGRVFAAGSLMLDGEDRPLLPAHLEVIGPCDALLTLHEGRYHQVRRMFAALGNHVETLHRDRIGGLSLPDDLDAGQWRLLEGSDLATLFGPRADR